MSVMPKPIFYGDRIINLEEIEHWARCNSVLYKHAYEQAKAIGLCAAHVDSFITVSLINALETQNAEALRIARETGGVPHAIGSVPHVVVVPDLCRH